MITVRSAILVGIESHPVTITAEESMLPGGILITGLSPTTMHETRVRAKSSLAQCGIESGNVDIVVTPEVTGMGLLNSGSFDLAIALAIAALRGKTGTLRRDVVYIGELSLAGKLLPVRGAVAHARAVGTSHILLPRSNASDAAFTNAQVIYCSTLDEAIGGGVQSRPHWTSYSAHESVLDVADIASPAIRRALEISAAGRHSLLLVGGPGTGKTMAARRLAGILPRLTADEALDVLTIHDAAGLRGGTRQTDNYNQDPVCRPFRAPHYTVSETGLFGGGDHPRPGEVTLAHHGVLFLDEVHEFRKSALEALGRVLSEGKVTLRRTATMPAVPLLVGAANPCACGLTSGGMLDRRCTCTPERLKSWRDRAQSYEALFALRVEVPDLRMAGVTSGRSSSAEKETSAKIRARVECSHALFVTSPKAKPATPQARIARTIAALDQRDIISSADMDEAKSFMVKP